LPSISSLPGETFAFVAAIIIQPLAASHWPLAFSEIPSSSEGSLWSFESRLLHLVKA
jgi:hypothetical protein